MGVGEALEWLISEVEMHSQEYHHVSDKVKLERCKEVLHRVRPGPPDQECVQYEGMSE